VVGFHHQSGGFRGRYYDVGDFAELDVHHVWTVFRGQVLEPPVRLVAADELVEVPYYGELPRSWRQFRFLPAAAKEEDDSQCDDQD
ncbi:hypothetical protein LINPERPRIM_LOCUS34600, partial [Linum perenne]